MFDFFYNRHPGCECPSGFAGDHCEIHVATSAIDIVHNATSKQTVGAIVAIVLGTVFGVVLVFLAKELLICRAGPSPRFLDRGIGKPG